MSSRLAASGGALPHPPRGRGALPQPPVPPPPPRPRAPASSLSASSCCGCFGGGGASAEAAAAEARDAEIDARAREDAARERDTVRLLLLGSGESGKSTIFKQLRLLYGSECERPSRVVVLAVVCPPAACARARAALKAPGRVAARSPARAPSPRAQTGTARRTGAR